MPEAWTGKIIGKMHVHGITVQHLAGELGLSAPYVSLILHGKRNPEGIRSKVETAVEKIIKEE